MSTVRGKRSKKEPTPVTPSPPKGPSKRSKSCKKLLTSLTPSTLVTPSPSERPSRIQSEVKRPNLFPTIEEVKQKQWIKLLPIDVWSNILTFLGQTNPESVAYFGMW